MNITRLVLLFGLLLAALGCSHLAVAENTSKLSINDADLIPDVRVVIDISGSMNSNDPQNLRRSALELLVQLFPEGSKAGVWTFGQWVNNLVTSKNVDQAWRTDAFSKAAKINSVALHTNIPAALERAVDDIDSLDPRYKVHLILLTDGMVDISKSVEENRQARQHIIDVMLPRLRAAGVTVHTIALSKNADQALMQRLALETGGLAAVAETADELSHIFVQAFDAAVPAEQLPLDDNRFTVDAGVDEFTALIFRKQGSAAATLMSPDKQSYRADHHGDDISWFHQHNYDLITVKNPEAGDWSIEADLEPGSRITIVSNLKLRVNPLANNYFVSDTPELVAALTEQDAVIDRPALLNLVDMRSEVTRREDGRQWQLSLSEFDPSPVDGRFRSALDMLEQVGIYDVVINAKGKTFQRQQRQTLVVREAFDIRYHSTRFNPPVHSVSLFARNHAIDTSSTTVTAHITLPDGNQQSMAAVAMADRAWQIMLEGIDTAGYYTVNFALNGQLFNGDTFAAQTHSLQIEHPVAGQAISPVAEPDPKTAAEPIALSQPASEHALAVETDWQQNSLYGVFALGNLLVILLAWFAYNMVKASNIRSDVLAGDDYIEIDGDAEWEQQSSRLSSAAG